MNARPEPPEPPEPPDVPERPEPPRRPPVALIVALGAVLVWALVARGVVDADTVLVLSVLFPSVILHEVSHGAVALAFGDDTAQKAGRLTLNPASHVDVLGTLVLPGLMVLAGAPVIGWAKPVPVTPRRLRHPRNHTLLVSLAGPAVNICLALLAALVLRSVLPSGAGDFTLGHRILLALGVVNVVLAVFNLIPVPPLDGSALVERLLPAAWWPAYLRVRQYSMVILLVLVVALPGALTRVFEPAVDAWYRLVG